MKIIFSIIATIVAFIFIFGKVKKNKKKSSCVKPVQDIYSELCPYCIGDVE